MTPEEEQAAWEARRDRPVTAGELAHVLTLIHVALLQQSIATLGLIEGSEEFAHDAAAKSIERAGSLLDMVRDLVGTPPDK